ncbi:hypothetical protein [Gymnodinialimonas ulvae]|uniref:hypothetical protein n=1 Tax=Gymnodinialimonas ulvae TaxID=3126504 RepID=UPI0030EE7169
MDITEVEEDAQLTRFQNCRVRDRAEIERHAIPRPARKSPDALAKPLIMEAFGKPDVAEPVAERTVSAPEAGAFMQPQTCTKGNRDLNAAAQEELPISADILRRALPKRFAEKNLDAQAACQVA